MKKLLLALLLFGTISCVKNNDPEDPYNPGKTPDNGEYALADNVTEMDEKWDEYVSSVEDGMITFSQSLPSSMQPKVGDILLMPDISEAFPYGFLGRVVSNSDGTVTTEEVPLDEAFEELEVDFDGDITDKITTILDAEGNEVDFKIIEDKTRAERCLSNCLSGSEVFRLKAT